MNFKDTKLLNKIIKEGKEIEEILKMNLEILMNAEREEGHNVTSKDMSNGYRYRKKYGRVRIWDLKVPLFKMENKKFRWEK